MKELFFKYFNECFPLRNKDFPEAIFYVYDPQIIREQKLNRILDIKDNAIFKKYVNEDPISRTKVYFQINTISGHIWVNDDLWGIFRDKFNVNYVQLRVNFELYTNNKFNYISNHRLFGINFWRCEILSLPEYSIGEIINKL